MDLQREIFRTEGIAIATILKEKITRLARKEQKGDSERLGKAASQHRSEIAALKRRITDLERMVNALAKKVTGKAPAEDGGLKKKTRFSAKRLQAWRKRVKLSAAEVGQLVGVSAQTVHHWESGMSRPKGEALAAAAALRTAGKRKITAKLAELAPAVGTP